MDSHERELVDSARGGSSEAFSELYAEHYALVTFLASRIVGYDDAEDVAQNAFLHAWKHIKTFNGDASFKTWISHVTFNAAIDHIRREGDRAVSLQEALDRPMRSHEQQVIARVDAERALSHLQPEERDYILRQHYGETIQEITSAVGQSKSTIIRKANKARNKMARRLTRKAT